MELQLKVVVLSLLILFYSTFLVSDGRVTGTSCRKAVIKLRAPPHSTIERGRNVRQVVITCNEGYLTADKKSETFVKCNRGVFGKLPACYRVVNYSHCGLPPSDAPAARARIVGGKVSHRLSWPWVVRMFIDDMHNCGGTIISNEWVLTAAHCFKPDRWTPLVQPHRISLSFYDKNVTNVKYFMHEGYDDTKYKNDIALVRIPEITKFDRHKQRICLPALNVAQSSVQVNRSLRAIGWGGTKHVKKYLKAKHGDLSSVLKEVSLPLLANKDCAKKVKDMQDAGWKNWYFNNKTQFCAGDKLGKSDTCHGDSGGPAMVKHYDSKSTKMRWYQVGIVSWGYGCAQKDEYSYYTKVSSYLDWIRKTTKGTQLHRF